MWVLILVQISFWDKPPLKTELAIYSTKEECLANASDLNTKAGTNNHYICGEKK